VLFPSGGSWPGTLMTRFEIIESKNVPLVEGKRPKDLFTRHWGRGVIELPGGDALVVHSAHLMPGDDPAVRVREVAAMLTSMKKDLDANRSMLLLGDLNHGPDTAEYSAWIDAGWVDTFAEVRERIDNHGRHAAMENRLRDGRGANRRPTRRVETSFRRSLSSEQRRPAIIRTE